MTRNTRFRRRLKKLLKKVEVVDENPIESEFQKNIKQLIEQIKWNLNDRNVIEDQTIFESEHIFISHDITCRETCLRLKEKLEKSEYKVWMDMNNSIDLDFNSNIKAIQNSSCFLMCVTER